MDMNKTNKFKTNYDDDAIGEENLKNGMDFPEKREVNIRDEVKSRVKFVILVVITGLITSVGFSFFAQALAYKNQLPSKIAKKSGEIWDIAFTDVKMISKKGNAVEKNAPTFTNTHASFSVELKKPGDEIKYSFNISNRGSLDAQLNNIILTPKNNDDDEIVYFVEDIKEYDYLDVGQTTKMTVTVKYNDNVKEGKATIKNAQIVLNYVQR